MMQTMIVLDPFHIIKHMNLAVEDILGSQSGTAEAKDLLKRSRCIWTYSQENLPERYREGFELLKKSDLKTARAYAINKNLGNLWQSSTDEEAILFCNDWYMWALRSKPAPVARVAKMMKHYLYGIPWFFKHRITNAMAEGISSRIATVHKTAHGYRNKENLKTAIFFHCGNLDMGF